MTQKNTSQRGDNYLEHSASSQRKQTTRYDSASKRSAGHERAVSNPVPGKNGGKNK